MNSWFAKLRISTALDAEPTPPELSRTGTAGADELRRFEEELAALDSALRTTVPKAEAPALLHDSIMRAVQEAERPGGAQREPAVLRWLLAPAVAVAALLVVWLVARGPVGPSAPKPQSLSTAANALELGGQVVQAVPSAVVSPLSDELQRLNRDLNSTAQFLLASLP